MKNLIIKILFLVVFTSTMVYSQIDSSYSVESLNDSGFVMQKSPTGAMLRSMVLPGWGQAYNEAYWKIPVIWGISAWFIYVWVKQNDNYKSYRDLYKNSLLESSTGNKSYKSARDFYRDDRDLFAIYLGLTYFLNFIDAYVDAHLFDFDIGINNYTHKPELKLRMKL